MILLRNPVLKGFFPDPSICRVGEDYYIATSTFEWFPGVRISHSKDLVNWRTLKSPLSRLSQLDMRGVANSGGIWAPCLTWYEGTFYLLFTDVKRWTGAHKENLNYLVTAESIEGPWSEPIFLNSSGFDPSMYHEEGRHWVLNMIWDFRPNRNRFGGIALQEYDPKLKCLVGPVKNIFRGSPLGVLEGPHIFKKDGLYYLICAEGGTFSTHAVTVARSENLDGEYVIMPGNPLLTSSNDPENSLQSAGHGCFVEAPDGAWYMAHLCRRPLSNGRSILGRETAIQRIVWDSDLWPRLFSREQRPELSFEVPFSPHPWPENKKRDDFDEPQLGLEYQSLRIPLDDSTMSLSDRPGYLRLFGRESLQSHFKQALVCRRIQDFHIRATTKIDFKPEVFQQMAGITAFYSTYSFYYLYLTWTEHSSKAIGIMKCEKDVITFPLLKEVPVDRWDELVLRIEIERSRIRFFYGNDEAVMYSIGVEDDASILSDEHGLPFGFTGAMIGLACQDLSGAKKYADFDWFDYEEINHGI